MSTLFFPNRVGLRVWPRANHNQPHLGFHDLMIEIRSTYRVQGFHSKQAHVPIPASRGQCPFVHPILPLASVRYEGSPVEALWTDRLGLATALRLRASGGIGSLN